MEMINNIDKVILALIGAIITLVMVKCASADINMDIIAEIESSGDYMAYNKYSGARGLYQITPIYLKDFNRCTNSEYQLDDLYEPTVNKLVAYWYINKRLPEILLNWKVGVTDEFVLIAYNWGPGNLRKWILGKKTIPEETKDYLIKYKRLDGKL